MMFTRTSEASAGFAVAEPDVTPEDRQSERSEVCRDREKGKYLLPEGRGGLAAQRSSGVSRRLRGAPLGRTGAGEDRLRRRREALLRRRTQPRGRAGERLAGSLPRIAGHGCAAGHVLCEAVQAA